MPRRSVAETEASRRRILVSASRLMRERGYDGVGIDAITTDAGLTPGAFYTHFASKLDLFAAVVDDALTVADAAMPPIETVADIDRFVHFYLGRRMVRDLGAGCIVTALSADLARHRGSSAAKAAARYIALIQERLAAALAAAGHPSARDEAWRTAAQLIGAVVMARIVPASSVDELLDAIRRR